MSILKKYDSYVAYFDMLGFKSAVLKNVDKACLALTFIRGAIDSQTHAVLIKPRKPSKIMLLPDFREKIFALKHVRPYIFSDSILMFTLDDEPDDLISLLIVASKLFQELLVFKVPLRGGIAHGEFFVNEAAHTFCGVPLVRAYELGEKSKWIGLIIDDEVADHYFDSLHEGVRESDSLIEWDVPLKDGGKRKLWVFNWPPDMKYRREPPITEYQLYSVFKEMFVTEFDMLPSEIQDIYRNTAEFINYTYQKSRGLI